MGLLGRLNQTISKRCAARRWARCEHSRDRDTDEHPWGAHSGDGEQAAGCRTV